MQPLSKLILEKYQVRKTRKQKTEFIELLQKELKDHQMTIEQGGLFKSRNIVVGDLEKCQYVLGAHYDTAPVLPIPNFISPKNVVAYMIYTLLLTLGIFAIDFIISIIIWFLTKNSVVALMIGYFVLIFMIGWMLVGKANQHTANDNTSGVITLIEALHDENLKDQVCCVFFDHEEVGLFGSANFAKKHKKIMKNKLLFNFDCVSDGDTIMLILNKKAKKDEKMMKEAFQSDGVKKVVVTHSSTTLYPSDQVNFKYSIGVAAFNQNKIIGYYLGRIHTMRDVIFEEKNIELIINGLKNLVK